MSGPKRATWSFSYDPTPTRIQDLESFAATQEAWLNRNGGFIRRYLGEEALTAASNALACVDECIAAEGPDAGFDAYGDAWNLFNELHRRAREAKRQEQNAKREAWLRQRQAAEDLVSECHALWGDQNSQDLLRRWIGTRALERLRVSLDAVSGGKPSAIQRKAKMWRRRWDEALSQAEQAAEANAKTLRDQLPKLRTALGDIQNLNAQILPDVASYEREKERLRQRADEALRDEDAARLRACVGGLRRLREAYAEKIRAAEFKKATDNVRDALAVCGYAVESREDADGTVILQASGFPTKVVNVQMKPANDEIRLNVEDEQGRHCVQDIQSLQAELARHDIQLSITDWGKGNPHGVHTRLEQNTVIGGRS